MTKCEHGKFKPQCRECGGSAFCEHGRRRTTCRECGGSQICKHSKRKNTCKECGGSEICEHEIHKSFCKQCGGSQICEHGKQKSRCKKCGGSQICSHGKQKSYCIDCGGSLLCSHGKRKNTCKDCGGSEMTTCKHGKFKPQCRECGGSAFCEHGRRRTTCRECGGSQICKHGKKKPYCIDCGGSALCRSELCETTGNNKYEGYCLRCFIHLFPDKPNTRNYKTKEKDVVDRIIHTFTNFTWSADKKIQGGCSRRRPDLLLDMGSHIIILEVDENKHIGYDCSCEDKRLMEISKDLQHRPIVFIRFNPDAYTTQDGVLVKSCWKLNKLGVMQIMKTKQKEWEERINSLKQQIHYWIENPTEKTIEIIELFY